MTTIPRDLAAVLGDLRAAIEADARLERSRRRRRRAALVLVPAALALGAAAYALSRTDAERVAGDIACHNEPRLDSGRTGIVAADGRDPTTICAEVDWAGSPPPLVACADAEHGNVHVFPGRDAALCARLGLEPVPTGYRAASRAFAAMRDDMVARIAYPREQPCVREAEARRDAREVLDGHGFRHWTIETSRFSDATPCAELWFDTSRGVVGLVGGSPPRD